MTGMRASCVADRPTPQSHLPYPPKKQDLQDSVIKCVRFAPSASASSPDRLALAGDDRDVRVVDLRSNTQGDGLRIPQAHARTVHTLRWHPTEVSVWMDGRMGG